MNSLRNMCVVTVLLVGVSFTQSAHADVRSGSRRVQRLIDINAIKDTAACYGQGHDAIFDDLGGTQRDALAILRECFAEDVRSEVVFFGVTTDRLDNLEQLVEFIEDFAIATNYTSARNIVGDVRVRFTGPHSAIMTSATATPHFITGDGTAAPTMDLVTARYVDRLERRRGHWRVVQKTLIIDEIWRGVGVYPFAQ